MRFKKKVSFNWLDILWFFSLDSRVRLEIMVQKFYGSYVNVGILFSYFFKKDLSMYFIFASQPIQCSSGFSNDIKKMLFVPS